VGRLTNSHAGFEVDVLTNVNPALAKDFPKKESDLKLCLPIPSELDWVVISIVNFPYFSPFPLAYKSPFYYYSLSANLLLRISLIVLIYSSKV